MYVLNSNKNVIIFKHKPSNTDIELYYRNPTTTDRVGYKNERIIREGDQIQFNVPQTRIKYAEKIITGIREGDFGHEIDGVVKPLSCVPGSENYKENWKEIIKENAPDILEAVAAFVFDDPVEIVPPDEAHDKKNFSTTSKP